MGNHPEPCGRCQHDASSHTDFENGRVRWAKCSEADCPCEGWQRPVEPPKPVPVCSVCGHRYLDHVESGGYPRDCAVDGCKCLGWRPQRENVARTPGPFTIAAAAEVIAAGAKIDAEEQRRMHQDGAKWARKIPGEGPAPGTYVPATEVLPGDQERTLGIRAACRMWAASLGELKRTDPVPTPETLIERTIALVERVAAAEALEAERYKELQGVQTKLDAHRETLARMALTDARELALVYLRAHREWSASVGTEFNREKYRLMAKAERAWWDACGWPEPEPDVTVPAAVEAPPAEGDAIVGENSVSEETSDDIPF